MITNKKQIPPLSLTDSSVHFGSGDPFPILRRLHFGFNIIPKNPRLFCCYGVLKKFSITICIEKQFLNEFNTALFLIISQNTRYKFCTEVTDLQFFSKNLMAKYYADACFV
jgi:hypothetical protein